VITPIFTCACAVTASMALTANPQSICRNVIANAPQIRERVNGIRYPPKVAYIGGLALDRRRDRGWQRLPAILAAK
jgi:hypothetical protein